MPRNSISGRALVAVVAIMTFLASLTTGAVVLIDAAAGEWQSDVAREVTIQVIPAPGRDVDAAVVKAAGVARAFPGIADVRTYSKEESAKLLEPWLGQGLSLDELPVPRLIVVKIGGGPAPDIPQLRRVLAEQVPGATLDDHRGWIDRMRTMAGSAVAAGIGVLLLMIAATMLSVTFATRGAMATNRPVIEVLHFVGAKNGFIAGHFQRHFLLLGLEGGAIGGGAAIVLFALRRRDQPLVCRLGGRRADRGAVRVVFHRALRLYCGCRSGRADRGGDGGDLAADRQPHAGNDRLMLAGFARWIGFLTMAAGIVGAMLLAGGFFWFAAQVPAEEVTLDRKADGIVVLTGAASRIPDAIELLAAGARQAAADHRRAPRHQHPRNRAA